MTASTSVFGKREQAALIAPIVANNPIGVQELHAPLTIDVKHAPVGLPHCLK